MSLRQPTMKMSKSHEDVRSRILITDSGDDIRAKIRGALTDSEPGITFDPVNRPGLANLLQIVCSVREDINAADLAHDFCYQSLGALKSFVSSCVIDYLAQHRARYFELQRDIGRNGILRQLAEEGAVKARLNASRVLTKVYKNLGLTS